MTIVFDDELIPLSELAPGAHRLLWDATRELPASPELQRASGGDAAAVERLFPAPELWLKERTSEMALKILGDGAWRSYARRAWRVMGLRGRCVNCLRLLPADAQVGQLYCANRYCAVKAWRNRNRDKYRAGQLKNYHDNPQKSAARWAVKLAVLDGTLIKPKVCSECPSERYIEGHHHNGYEDAHKLEVTWLCKKCHGRRHRKDAAEL